MSERTKTLVLKRAMFPNGDEVSLEKILRRIFDLTSHPTQRVLELDLVRRAVIAQLDFGPSNEGVFVRILEYEAGALGSINFDGENGSASIEGVEPPPGQNFLQEDVGLFVVGNDVIACGMANKNRTYGECVMALASRCGASGDGVRLSLSDVPNRTNLEDLHRIGVREISLGVSDYLASIPQKGSLRSRVMDAIFVKPSDADEIQKRSAATGRLSLSRGRFSKDEIRSDPWLTSVGEEIVESDTDEDYTIVLEDQRRLTNRNLKMIKKVRVKKQLNTVNYVELKGHMTGFFSELRRAGVV